VELVEEEHLDPLAYRSATPVDASYTPLKCVQLCRGTLHVGSKNAEVEVATKKEHW
jgi:hypothetical protein